MKGNEFLEKMDLIDPSYIESAEYSHKNTRSAWIKFGAAAACLLIIVSAVIAIPRAQEPVHASSADETPAAAAVSSPESSIPEELQTGEPTPAKVTYVNEGIEGVQAPDYELIYLTEDEMFSRKDLLIFRGRVVKLTNMIVEFGDEWYEKDYYCVAELEIEKVYKGEIEAGEHIRILLNTLIGSNTVWIEDNDTIEYLKEGMEGIFMPAINGPDTHYVRDGKVFDYREHAECRLDDGTRWAFLDTGSGLSYSSLAYPGAGDAKTLEDIEAYVYKMLEKVAENG